MKAIDIPRAFRSLVTLRALNVLAVGASLAAATGAVLGRVFAFNHYAPEGVTPFDGEVATVSALSTLAFGIAWAMLLRWRATVGKSAVRLGWVASVPMAMLNSATACALLYFHREISDMFVGAVAGATFGAICWVPGLMATLVFFGLPIAWSQKLAAKGLAGEERGELVVGAVATAVASVGGALLLPHVAPTLGFALIGLLAALGTACGIAAVVLALWRERLRRAFVARVDEGAVPGYRVDATDEGKVLVRITSLGQGYRVTDFEEPLYRLDAEGDAVASVERARS